MDSESCWWAIYKNYPHSKDSLIAFVKSSKKQMQRVLVGIYFGNVSITREEPSELNYHLEKGGEKVIHSIEKLDAIKISRRIFSKENLEIKEDQLKVWYEINTLKKTKKSDGKKIPNAYLVSPGHIKEYSSILKPEVEIDLTKNPKKLEFKVLDKNKKVMGLFNSNKDANTYNNKFLGGLGKVTPGRL